ncbi:MAG: 50S ribosomal protein L15 [Chloroflexota bacterium]
MRLHDLRPAPGATTDKKRLGRGNASGQGTTAGKGTKGQKARAGGAKAGFRGMSSRNARVAKRRGFTSRFRVEYLPVNLDRLTTFESGSTIDAASLAAAGLISRGSPGVKILGNGEVAFPLHVVGLKVSASAKQKIESAGGSVADEMPAVTQE